MIMDAADVATVPLVTVTMTDMTNIMAIDMITGVMTGAMTDVMTDVIVDVVTAGIDTIAVITGVRKHERSCRNGDSSRFHGDSFLAGYVIIWEQMPNLLRARCPKKTPLFLFITHFLIQCLYMFLINFLF